MISTARSTPLRVSAAALLRLRLADQRLVLVGTGGTPLGPFGGALTYRHSTAGPRLAALGWRPERAPRGDHVDLRGTVPVRAFAEFVSWFAAGQGRESGESGLRREIIEELGEAGHPIDAGLVAAARLTHVRTITEDPAPLAGGTGWQTRHLEVYDLGPGVLADHLATLAADPTVRTIHAVSEADIARGSTGLSRIGTQAAYLADSHPDRPGITVTTHRCP